MLPLDRPIIYQGIAYHTVENFYQAMKIPKNQLELRKRIAAMNPRQAKKEIRKHRIVRRKKRRGQNETRNLAWRLFRVDEKHC